MNAIRELYRYRTLIASLVARELSARYRGSILGFLWTFLNPLLLTAVYSIVFSVVMRIQMPHYTFYLLCGLLPWIWFSTALLSGTSSIGDRRDLLNKVRFAPEVLPTVATLSAGMNFVFSLPILLAFATIAGPGISLHLFEIIPVAIVQLIFTIALVFILSTANVFFRDLHHLLGNIVTLWFFLCPIVYRYEDMPADYRFLIDYDPIAVIMRGYQSALYSNTSPDWTALLGVLGLSVVLFGISAFVIGRFRESFAEQV